MIKDLKTCSIEELEAEIKRRDKYPETIATGYLKESLISTGGNNTIILSHWLLPETTLRQEIEDYISEQFKIAKGTKFVKIKFDKNDEGSWFDDIDFGLEEMDDEWAEKFLERKDK